MKTHCRKCIQLARSMMGSMHLLLAFSEISERYWSEYLCELGHILCSRSQIAKISWACRMTRTGLTVVGNHTLFLAPLFGMRAPISFPVPYYLWEQVVHILNWWGLDYCTLPRILAQREEQQRGIPRSKFISRYAHAHIPVPGHLAWR